MFRDLGLEKILKIYGTFWRKCDEFLRLGRCTGVQDLTISQNWCCKIRFNKHLVTKFGVDTAENEPSEVSSNLGVLTGSVRGFRKYYLNSGSLVLFCWNVVWLEKERGIDTRTPRSGSARVLCVLRLTLHLARGAWYGRSESWPSSSRRATKNASWGLPFTQ